MKRRSKEFFSIKSTHDFSKTVLTAPVKWGLKFQLVNNSLNKIATLYARISMVFGLPHI